MPRRSPSARTKKAKAQPANVPATDLRTIPGACVRIPSGSRCYVESIDPKNSERVIVTYEAGLGQDSYPLHLLTLVNASPNADCFRAIDEERQAALEGRSEDWQIVSGQAVTDHNWKSLLEQADAEPKPAKQKRRQRKAKQPTLDQLATQINALHQDCEAAMQVAQNAEQSALQHAIRAGELLLQAKEAAGHGNWEKWRDENLNLPSSTATLYQRCFERKHELEGISTLREARKLLKKERQSKELDDAPAETKSATVADLPAQFQRGDRVQIQAEDDLYGSAAIVAGSETDEWGVRWVDVRCAEFAGMALDYRATDLKLIQVADAASMLELEQAEQIESEPTADFLSDLQIEAAIQMDAGEPELQIVSVDAAEKRLAINRDNGKAVCSSRLSLTQAAREVAGSVVEAIKLLLADCSPEGLEVIGEAVLDEQFRREGYANAEEGMGTKMAEFIQKHPRKQPQKEAV